MSEHDILALGRELGFSGKILEDFLRDERLKRREEIQFQLEQQERRAKLKKEEDELTLALVREQIKLEAAREANRSKGDENYQTRSQVYHKLMPPFDESKDDMDSYLLRFERLALARKWPEPEWASALSLHLAGDALEVYARIPPEDSVDYQKLKHALLLRFRLTEEGFRESFRNSKPKDGETATQFLARLSMYVERWIDLSKTEKEYEALRDLVIREQFLNKCDGSLAMFLKERTYENLEEIGKAADRFIEAQGFCNIAGKIAEIENSKSLKKGARQENPTGERKLQTTTSVCFVCQKAGHRAVDCRHNMYKHMTCLKCGRRGHRAVDCGKIGRNEFQPQKRENNINYPHTGGNHPDKGRKTEASAIKCVYTEQGDKIDVVVTTIQNPDSLFIVPDMPVVNGIINNQRGTVLRDSGCNTIIVRKQLLKPNQLTGRQKAIYFLDHVVKLLPEAEIEIDTPYFQGRTLALVMVDPLYDLTLGNVPGVREVESPNREWVMPIIEQREKKDKTGEKLMDNLGHSEQENPPGGEIVSKERENTDREIKNEVSAVTRAQAKSLLEEKKTKPLKVTKVNIAHVTPQELQNQQLSDTTLRPYFQKIDQVCKRGNGENEYIALSFEKVHYTESNKPKQV